jgi:hypothetical protein
MPHPIVKNLRGTCGNRSLTNVKGWPPRYLQSCPALGQAQKRAGIAARLDAVFVFRI